MKKITLYCKCGAAWEGTVPEAAAWGIMDQWSRTHKGAGHEACDAKTAARNRAASERDTINKANASATQKGNE